MTNEKEHDEYQLGPIDVKRTGRSLRVSSRWDPPEHKEFLERIRIERPNIKKKVDDCIHELLEIVRIYDPLKLIAPISVVNLTMDPETYSEATHRGDESIVEYLLSAITSTSPSTSMNEPSADIIQKTIDILKQIKQMTIIYYGMEMAEGRYDQKEAELRFRIMLHSLGVRGPSYPQHVRQTFLELFQPHDSFLTKNFGLSSKQIFELAEGILHSVESITNESRQALYPLIEPYKKFVQYQQKHPSLEHEDLVKRFKAKYGDLPDKQNEEKIRNYLQDLGGPAIFQIRPEYLEKGEFIRAISLKPSENDIFVNVKNHAAWFLNPSRIFERPILHVGNNFYCFSPTILLRNLGFIVEKLIESKDRDYLRTFYNSRDK